MQYHSQKGKNWFLERQKKKKNSSMFKAKICTIPKQTYNIAMVLNTILKQRYSISVVVKFHSGAN